MMPRRTYGQWASRPLKWRWVSHRTAMCTPCGYGVFHSPLTNMHAMHTLWRVSLLACVCLSVFVNEWVGGGRGGGVICVGT